MAPHGAEPGPQGAALAEQQQRMEEVQSLLQQQQLLEQQQNKQRAALSRQTIALAGQLKAEQIRQEGGAARVEGARKVAEAKGLGGERIAAEQAAAAEAEQQRVEAEAEQQRVGAEAEAEQQLGQYLGSWGPNSWSSKSRGLSNRWRESG